MYCTVCFVMFGGSAWGWGKGGGGLPDFFFFFPCSADHERDLPPCKVVFFRLATNAAALNVRNNNNIQCSHLTLVITQEV